MTLSHAAVVRLVVGVVVGVAAGEGYDAVGGAQAVERHLYVSVIDQSGQPVTDLKASDFDVREDGVLREVLRVAPATDPMDVAVVIDNSQAASPAITEMRRGLTTFVQRMHERHTIALITFGERPTILQDYTHTLPQLTAAVNRIFARPGSGAYLLEALVETSRGLEKRESRRPVVVVVATEGEEFSNLYFRAVLDALYASQAQLHALILTSGGTPPLTDGNRNRTMVLSEGTTATGGRRDFLLTVTSISGKLADVAAELSNQYVLIYARPRRVIPPETVDVTVRRPGLVARARRHAGTL